MLKMYRNNVSKPLITMCCFKIVIKLCKYQYFVYYKWEIPSKYQINWDRISSKVEISILTFAFTKTCFVWNLKFSEDIKKKIRRSIRLGIWALWMASNKPGSQRSSKLSLSPLVEFVCKVWTNNCLLEFC